MTTRPRVLVLCTGNKARSQMAEGWIRHFGRGRLDVVSAGTRPSGVWQLVIEAMSEAGVDISTQWSKSVNEFTGQEFDYVVTLCNDAKEGCPVFPGARRTLHVPFLDPWLPPERRHEEPVLVRRIRDEIRDWAQGFVAEVLA
ncbi:MAG: arsenate reductase ArsC [Fimbriimonadaceae bacterium]